MDLANTVVVDIDSDVPLLVSFLLLVKLDMDLANTVVVDIDSVVPIFVSSLPLLK